MGSVLGINQKSKFSDTKINLKQGSNIIFYTDGVIESFDNNNQQYGEKRLINAISNYHESEKEQILDYIKKDIKKYTGKKDYWDDDITMIGIYLKNLRDKPK